MSLVNCANFYNFWNAAAPVFDFPLCNKKNKKARLPQCVRVSCWDLILQSVPRSPLSVLSLPQKICIIESPAIAIVVTVFALFYIWELCQVFFLAWRGFFPVRNLINQPSTLAFRSVWSPALWSKRDHQQWNHKTPSGKKLITPAKIGEQSSLGL